MITRYNGYNRATDKELADMKQIVSLKKISIMILLIGLVSYCEKHSPDKDGAITSFSEEYTEQEHA